MDRAEIEAVVSEVLDAAEKLQSLVGDLTGIAETLKEQLPE